MLMKLSLAAMAALVVQAEAIRQPPTAPPQKLNAVLCQTEAQATALASNMGAGWITPYQGAKLERRA